LIRSVLVLLAPGTQWSQKPIESLPAAFAVRMYGAVINAADDSAVAATNCRRESFLRDMIYSLPGEPIVMSEIRLLFLFLHLPAGPQSRLPDAVEISF
jgi:hypothetical protein